MSDNGMECQMMPERERERNERMKFHPPRICSRSIKQERGGWRTEDPFRRGSSHALEVE
jgi:hypothetical protein